MSYVLSRLLQLHGVSVLALPRFKIQMIFLAQLITGAIPVSVFSFVGVRCVVAVRCVFPSQIFVGGLDQEVNDADFRAYFAK